MNLSFLQNKYFLFISGIIIGVLFLSFAVRVTIINNETSDFHEHADFALYLDGEKFDFSKDKYMHVEPCKVSFYNFIQTSYAHGDESEGTSPRSDVDLHGSKGNVIHVHKEGVTYLDFFESLEMDFHDTYFIDDSGNRYEDNAEKEFRFFVNNKELDTLYEKEIRNFDQVLITYGEKNRTDDSISIELGSITNEACIASEVCTHRKPLDPEFCSVKKAPLLLRVLGLALHIDDQKYIFLSLYQNKKNHLNGEEKKKAS